MSMTLREIVREEANRDEKECLFGFMGLVVQFDRAIQVFDKCVERWMGPEPGKDGFMDLEDRAHYLHTKFEYINELIDDLLDSEIDNYNIAFAVDRICAVWYAKKKARENEFNQ